MADLTQTYLLLKHKSDNLSFSFLQVEALRKPELTVQSIILRQIFATFNIPIRTGTCVQLKVVILRQLSLLVYSFISGQRWGPLKVPFRIYQCNLRSSAFRRRMFMDKQACLLFHKDADESESTAKLMLSHTCAAV